MNIDDVFRETIEFEILTETSVLEEEFFPKIIPFKPDSTGSYFCFETIMSRFHNDSDSAKTELFRVAELKGMALNQLYSIVKPFDKGLFYSFIGLGYTKKHINNIFENYFSLE